MTPVAPAGKAAAPVKEPIPFPLTDEELKRLAMGMGGLFSEQEPFERSVATEILDKEAKRRDTAPATEASPDIITDLHEAEVQLATMARGKGLHPLPTPEAFGPVLEKILAESPAFKVALPSVLKSLVITGGLNSLNEVVKATKDPRYRAALAAGEEKAQKLLDTAMKLFPPKDPKDLDGPEIAVRKALLEQWPAVEKLPTREQAVIMATILGLVGQGPTTSPTAQDAKDMMAQIARQLQAMMESIGLTEFGLRGLVELDKVVDEWEKQKQQTEAAGDTWVPPTIVPQEGVHGPTGLWIVVDPPKVVPKGGTVSA